MKRQIGVALITAMLSFTGIANAGDVAISHGMTKHGEVVLSWAWAVINDEIYFCTAGIGSGSPLKRCMKLDKDEKSD